MKRVFIFIGVAILLCAPVSAAPLGDDAKAVLLLQRVANQFGQGNTDVAVGKVTKGAPLIPVPTDELLGSVHVNMKSQQSAGEMTTLYYVGLPDSAARYQKALLTAGWTTPVFPGRHAGGFVQPSDEGAGEGIYCKKDGPTIMVQSTGIHKDDFRVIASQGVNQDIFCDPAKMVQLMAASQPVLPELQAPAGMQMEVAKAGNTLGRSGAHIRGATSPQAVLADFTKQLVASGWTAGATSANDTIASQTYHFVDAMKVPWQCLLTVYAVDGRPGEVLAFIDLTDLSKLKK